MGFPELISALSLLLLSVSAYLRGGLYLIPSAMLGSLLLAIFLRQRFRNARRDFVNQLKSYRKELRAGGTVIVEGMNLRLDTELSAYRCIVGTLFSTLVIESIFRKTEDGSHPDALTYSLGTLLLGWWSLSGPVWAMLALSENLRGGKRIKIQELINTPQVNLSLST